MKKYVLLLLVLLAVQPLHAMGDDQWYWTRMTAGIIALLGGGYVVYRISTQPHERSQEDVVALQKKYASMHLPELQYVITQACYEDDLVAFKEYVAVLVGRYNQVQWYAKIFEVPEYCLQIPFKINETKKLYAWVNNFEWYFQHARLFTYAFSQDFEQQKQEILEDFEFEQTKRRFVALIECQTDQDAVQKVIKKYNESDSQTRNIMLEYAKMFGHKDELFCRINAPLHNQLYALIKHKKSTNDVGFAWQ